MKNIKITIAYDGTEYHGFQIQKNAITVQEKVELALEKLLKKRVKIIYASRTDAKVHAKEQVFNIKVDTSIPIKKIPVALNTKLPDDIVALAAKEVADDFHARYHTENKRYVYQIYNERFISPFLRNYTCHIKKRLNLVAIKKATKYLIGTHDFSAFRAAGCNAKSPIREIFKIEIKKEGSLIKLIITGNGFLYNMVRIIAGTLIEIGIAKREPQGLKEILNSRDRHLAGFTAPAQGLFLAKVNY